MADLTPKQQEVIDYLRENPWSTAQQIADALKTTRRGAGVRISAINDHLTCRAHDDRGDIFDAERWEFALSGADRHA